MAADLTIHASRTGPPIKRASHPVQVILNGPYALDYDAHVERDRSGDIQSVWVGEVSWLKAALLGDEVSYVPPLVKAIRDTFPVPDSGETVTITDGIIGLVKERIAAAAMVVDETSYNIADPEQILIWLEQQKGKKAWVVSW